MKSLPVQLLPLSLLLCAALVQPGHAQQPAAASDVPVRPEVKAETRADLRPEPAATLPLTLTVPPVPAADLRPLDAKVLEAREALRKRDRTRLSQLRDELVAQRHPLAPWVDYWEIGLRLGEIGQNELEAFYARWPGSYVEDRLRNDWLVELGHRRDWKNFASELPRFRMADDRDVACYGLLLRHQAGEDVRGAARQAWLNQREPGEGCLLLATTLFEARRLSSSDAWLKARTSAEAGRLKLTREAVARVADQLPDKVFTELWEQPQRYLARRADATYRHGAELSVLALIRLATSDPQTAATLLDDRWQALLAPDAAAWTWAAVAKQASWKLMPEADAWFQRAQAVPQAREVDWSDETLAWRARAALRATDPARWQRVLAAIDAMTTAAQADATWVYWKARGLTALAASGPEGEAQRTGAAVLFERIAGQTSFYGKLSAEALGRAQSLPPRPAPLTPDERRAAELNPGLSRGLLLMQLGLRNEGVREWNFSTLDLNDRALLAAAQRACDREVWDRCIQASERTRGEIDMAQRYPMPYRAEVLAAAQDAGLEPAYVYGLIRQESRFVPDIRSSAGAAGLMQLMPNTARWTARKLGVAFSLEQITDRSVNLRLGTGYLRQVLDDFEGSQPLATAAYNAGPSRSRRWREGPPLEVAAWAEGIPFNETRDYVKKVLSNASYYAALMGGKASANLRQRLGPVVAPRAVAAPENKDLP